MKGYGVARAHQPAGPAGLPQAAERPSSTYSVPLSKSVPSEQSPWVPQANPKPWGVPPAVRLHPWEGAGHILLFLYHRLPVAFGLLHYNLFLFWK